MSHEPGTGETLDRLIGDWQILQLRRGHRFSTDDLLTAWEASRALPAPVRLLDLGSGIGSVGLMTLWPYRQSAHLTGVEVQEVSWQLAQRTVALNGLGAQVKMLRGDLRDPPLDPAERFDLVTGSPPYFPVGQGLISKNPQRAGARIELRGDVFDYCRTAAKHMAEEGRFCFCHSAADSRPQEAITRAGMVLLSRREVYFRAGRDPMISLFVCAWRGELSACDPVVVRDEEGEWTPGYLQIRREMGTLPAELDPLAAPVSGAPEGGP